MINNPNDINRLDLANQIKDIRENKLTDLKSQTDAVDSNKESFKDMLKGFVGDVNKMQKKADDSVNKLATGEITDVHDVMIKVEEANLSFSLMMEIRNKIVEGYKEVLRTNV
ncbi:MAG: flagellar hook-basal body complex protein FliE [Candidatus Cloacimonadota bacterium]|nr:MAG: flagellar hook-basal body complex protein FliE [Candidatus Cloacimonadota bacterium]PIE77695.1 MAG: flagellar hook-basal body complex protein FliE [Candidatus Delongbacteria bacterium]